MRHSFNWVFREFLRKKSPYPLASRLGRSEKLIYAWSMDEAIYTLLLKRAELKKKLVEKAEREGKNPPRRR
jgi:hypothetical protein